MDHLYALNLEVENAYALRWTPGYRLRRGFKLRVRVTETFVEIPTGVPRLLEPPLPPQEHYRALGMAYCRVLGGVSFS